MKAVVLAAGRGERLGKLTKDIPKPMLPLDNKPILQYTIEALADSGIKDIFINLHYHSEKITNYFGDGRSFGVNIRYSREAKLLGTAGAIKKLQRYLTEVFIVVYGDSLRKLNYLDPVKEHNKIAAIATIVLYETDSINGCGIVEIDRKQRVLRFLEKPKKFETKSRLANAGVYVLSPEVFDYIPEDKEFDFAKDLFPRLLNLNKPIFSFIIRDAVLDIGTPENYNKAKELFIRSKNDYNADTF